MGKTMRKEIKTDRLFELIQIRNSTINEATGVDLIAIIYGCNKISTMRKRPAATAKIIPTASAIKNPVTILANVNKIVLQNSRLIHNCSRF